jgi:GT2 family glycosyltransferase
LSVVVVTFRRRNLVLKCLSSVERALEWLAEPAELVVVDNGSKDGTAALIRQRFKRATVVEIEENIGFAPAVTQGISPARGEWIAILNDDVTVEREALAALRAAARTSTDVGSVAAQMRFASRPNVINSAGIDVDHLGIAADRLLGEPVSASETEIVEVFGASGGAAIYRRAMLEDIGGFDESFFAYLEDVDVAWRARMKGWRALYAPSAVVHHNHSATLIHGSPHKYYLVGRNRVRLLAKNATAAQLLKYGPTMLLYDIGYVTYVALMHRTLAPLRGRIQGVRDWRKYRRLGSGRKAVALARPLGIRRALARNRTWPRRGFPTRATAPRTTAPADSKSSDRARQL